MGFSSSRLDRVGALAGLALVACSGSYLASNVDAGSVDAAPPSTASAPPPADAGPATLLADATTGADAPLDARPRSPCASTQLFCDDFDEVGIPPAGKWSFTETAAGTFDHDETNFVSPGRSVRLQVVPGSGERSSSLSKNIDLPSGNFHVAFDLRLESPSAGTYQEIDPFVVLLTPQPAGVSLQLFSLAGYMDDLRFETYRKFGDGGSVGSGTSVNGMTLGVFHHVDLTVRSQTGQVIGALAIDGQTPVVQTFSSGPPTKAVVQIGAPYTSNANVTATLRFDNVLVEGL